MSKFIYLYRGPATQMEDLTAEQSEAQMRAWGEWIGRLGPALVDVGNPFGTRSAVADDGTSPAGLTCAARSPGCLRGSAPPLILPIAGT